MDLDRPVAGRIRLEHALYAILLATATLLRLLWLSDRPLHHDESIHAYYSWRILTHGPADYRYDPVYHGPTLYYLTAVFHALLGASDFSSRTLPVATSVGLVALAWPLRSLLGRREALAFAILVTISPTLGYYGRSLRHDVPMAFFTLAGVISFLTFLRDGKRHHLYLAGALAGLAAATKEDIYLTAFTLANSLWILGLWTGERGDALLARARRWLDEVATFVRDSSLPLATSILIALTLFFVFYTSLLTHPENWNAVSRALRYWWGQHQMQRIGGPWWYYLPLQVVYEPLLFFPALITLIAWIRRAPVGRLHGFVATWAILTFAIYAWAQEKVPWLLVPSLIPQALLAACYFGSLRARWLFAWAPVAGLSLWALVASNFLHDAPRTNEPPEASHNEPMVYVQSTYDVREVLAEIDAATRALRTGRKTPMVVTGNATWPLSWYLRDHQVHWGSLPAETKAPILVVDPKDADRLAKDLAGAYEQRRFAVRGWWQIDWSQFSPGNALRFLVYRLAWNPPGTTDAVLFVARDLSPQAELASHRLTPSPPERRYPEEADAVEPLRTFGSRGLGPGQLREPRGLAFDRDGNLLVADSKNNRVQKFAPSGQFLAVWGGPAAGEGPGQFREPSGLAVGSDGSVYVADTWNHRIQKLDAEGNFLLEWRKHAGAFWGPRAVAISPDGSIFVADTGNKTIYSYDPGGAHLLEIGGEGSDDGLFVEPVGLAVDSRGGRLYVADTGNRRVQVFDLEGRFVAKWSAYGWSEFYTEPYLTWHAASIIATDSFNDRINVYDPLGVLQRSIGGPKSSLDRPIGVAVSPGGELYVSDTMNDRIVVYALPGG